jgi:hypothetical protein
MKSAKRWIGIALFVVLSAIMLRGIYTKRNTFSIPDGAITAFQVAPWFDIEPDSQREHIAMWAVLDRATLTPADVNELRTAMNNRAVFDGDPRRVSTCFEPRLAFRIDDGGEQANLLICLHCQNARLYQQGTPSYSSANLTAVGVRRFTAITQQLFPRAEETERAALPKPATAPASP